MNKKIFSVIVPVYNAEKTIERTLASFISNADYINEVILVNDRSNDNTLEKIWKFDQFFDVKWIDNSGIKGAGTARKTGLNYAVSEWVTFVDADDCLTHSSLRYVYEQINGNDDVILLHSKSIFYESGHFNSDSIEYSDTSCGGNFYKRDYLINNSLYPHDSLYMAEDEYFNEKVIKYIEYCDTLENPIMHFDYPVYEVHHDNEDGLSFAMRNWVDYCCKYHLLYKEYLTKFFIKYENLYDLLFEEYCDNFIFVYFMCQGLMIDSDVKFSMEVNKKYFKRAINFIKITFGKEEKDLISYYKTNRDNTSSLLESARISTGVNIVNQMSFKSFVNSL